MKNTTTSKLIVGGLIVLGVIATILYSLNTVSKKEALDHNDLVIKYVNQLVEKEGVMWSAFGKDSRDEIKNTFETYKKGIAEVKKDFEANVKPLKNDDKTLIDAFNRLAEFMETEAKSGSLNEVVTLYVAYSEENKDGYYAAREKYDSSLEKAKEEFNTKQEAFASKYKFFIAK